MKTEIAEADVAELLQLFDSVEAKQYKRPDMNGDLRLGFALDDFAGTKWKNLTGTTRWSDGHGDGLLTLSVEGVFQLAYILPERLLALVRPAFDLVLRRIRSLKRCVQA